MPVSILAINQTLCTASFATGCDQMIEALTTAGKKPPLQLFQKLEELKQSKGIESPTGRTTALYLFLLCTAKGKTSAVTSSSLFSVGEVAHFRPKACQTHRSELPYLQSLFSALLSTHSAQLIIIWTIWLMIQLYL